tara:strand:+ start:58783 stop:58893 length:111 start_codon:yes stop_codon:yes gene_type:complete
MTRIDRIERLFTAVAATALGLYLLGFLHETAELYLV